MRPILIGVLAAFFFSFTFVLNRAMELNGDAWVWSASLRFFFMVPLLLLLFLGKNFKKNIAPIFVHIKKQPLTWLIWSTVGFGLFYAPLTFATIYAPGWLIAATFQLNIVAGSLLIPFINKNTNRSIPIVSVLISLLIIVGVFLTQVEHAHEVPVAGIVLTLIPLLISAVSYPLGNRKMMQVVNGELTTIQRITGMTICSLPFWFILSFAGGAYYGAPSGGQVAQTFVVALFSGIIATILFFKATEWVQNDNHKLAGVEATQAMEIIFTLMGEMIFLNMLFPGPVSLIGIALIMLGIIAHSIVASRKGAKPRKQIA